MFSRRFIVAQILFIIFFSSLFIFQKFSHQNGALPLLGKVMDFKLLDQDSREITLSAFKGKIWVADFIFTTCCGICPHMSKNMSHIQQATESLGDIHLVSFSVNPENDSPAVLKAYAAKYHVSADQWSFLTGTREMIQSLASKSFKMGDMKDIMFHSAYFALVDRQGFIRGYYEGTEKQQLKKLYHDLLILRKER